jgi:hypothetical protein
MITTADRERLCGLRSMGYRFYRMRDSATEIFRREETGDTVAMVRVRAENATHWYGSSAYRIEGGGA